MEEPSLPLSFCLCLQGYHGRATFFRNRVSEVRGEWGTRSKKLPHPFVLPPKILPRVPFSFCIPGACGSRTLPPLLSRQTLRKLVRMTEGPCARTCYVLEQDRKTIRVPSAPLLVLYSPQFPPLKVGIFGQRSSCLPIQFPRIPVGSWRCWRERRQGQDRNSRHTTGHSGDRTNTISISTGKHKQAQMNVKWITTINSFQLAAHPMGLRVDFIIIFKKLKMMSL